MVKTYYKHVIGLTICVSSCYKWTPQLNSQLWTAESLECDLSPLCLQFHILCYFWLSEGYYRTLQQGLNIKVLLRQTITCVHALTSKHWTSVQCKPSGGRCTRPSWPQKVKVPRILRESAHKGGMVVSLMNWPPLPPRRYSRYSLCYGPRTIARPVTVHCAVPQLNAPPNTANIKTDVLEIQSGESEQCLNWIWLVQDRNQVQEFVKLTLKSAGSQRSRTASTVCALLTGAY
jgi:hypothetical protein